MAAATWGKDTSRTEVVCKYCLKQMRKDNLGRHNAKVHPGKQESFSVKTLKGQLPLSFIVSGGKKGPGEAIRISS